MGSFPLDVERDEMVKRLNTIQNYIWPEENDRQDRVETARSLISLRAAISQEYDRRRSQNKL